MNQKELNEIRRHLSLKRCGIHKIYGCFVSSGKEIISDFQTSFGLMSEFEAEKYLSLLKKTLSGTLGKNLLDLSFSTQQVVDSPEHKRLSAPAKHSVRGAQCQSGLLPVGDRLSVPGRHPLPDSLGP